MQRRGGRNPRLNASAPDTPLPAARSLASHPWHDLDIGENAPEVLHAGEAL